MKREILLRHEAMAIAAKNGLAGLYELAQHQHVEAATRRGDAVIQMTGCEDPTVVTGFYFNPACGEGGIIAATCGASEEEDGLEGVRFLFESHEVAEAQAAWLETVRCHEHVEPQDRLFAEHSGVLERQQGPTLSVV